MVRSVPGNEEIVPLEPRHSKPLSTQPFLIDFLAAPLPRIPSREMKTGIFRGNSRFVKKISVVTGSRALVRRERRASVPRVLKRKEACSPSPPTGEKWFQTPGGWTNPYIAWPHQLLASAAE
jgi:hypothetical protein